MQELVVDADAARAAAVVEEEAASERSALVPEPTSRLPSRPSLVPRHPGRLALVDAAAVFGAMALAAWLRTSPLIDPLWEAVGLNVFPASFAWSPGVLAVLVLQLAFVPMALGLLGQFGTTPSGIPRWNFERLLIGATGSYAVLIVFLSVQGASLLPASFMVGNFGLLMLGLVGWRYAWRRRALSRLRDPEFLQRVLIVGTDATATSLADELSANPTRYGRRVVGLVAPDASLASHDLGNGSAGNGANGSLHQAVVAALKRSDGSLLHVVASTQTEDLRNALDGLMPREVFVSTEVPEDEVIRVFGACRARGIEVTIVPPNYPRLGFDKQASELGAFTAVRVFRRPFSPLGAFAKRTMDIIGAIVGLVLGAPILLVSAIAIKLEDRSLPVFYRGTCVGQGGRPFTILKLTTMRAHSKSEMVSLESLNEREGPWFKASSGQDPRVTRVGGFLRRFTINEIPQFWNVLVGQMSLVGPRPPLPHEVEAYADYDFRYYRCLEARPGMTSLWAVKARADPSFEVRVNLDIKYMENWTIWRDVGIVLRTSWTVIASREE